MGRNLDPHPPLTDLTDYRGNITDTPPPLHWTARRQKFYS